MRDGLRRWALVWSVVGGAALALLPWYATPDGVGIGRIWLLAPGVALLASLAAVLLDLQSRLGRRGAGPATAFRADYRDHRACFSTYSRAAATA